MLTPSRLWKQMTPAQRLAGARAFWMDKEAADDQSQAAALVARQKKFRPKTIAGLDADRKARYLASLPSLPDSIAGRLLVAYHLADQRPLMGRFLDALGITHDNGLIDEEAVVPDASKLAPAIADVEREFPSDDVRLYLETLICQDPDAWGALADLVRAGGARKSSEA